MKGIVIYKSKYGSTKKYAEWISERTGFDCVESGKTNAKQLADYDTVIFGGGIYASGIAGISFLKKNIVALNGKKVIAFCCGASPYDETFLNEIRNMNLKDELASVPLYYCRGACSLDGMSFKDKTLCKILRKSLEKKDPKDYAVWEAALVEAVDIGKDWTDIKYIDPIVEACNKL